MSYFAIMPASEPKFTEVCDTLLSAKSADKLRDILGLLRMRFADAGILAGRFEVFAAISAAMSAIELPLPPAPLSGSLSKSEQCHKEIRAILDSMKLMLETAYATCRVGLTPVKKPSVIVREPSKDELTVYRYWLVTGKKQIELEKDAALMELLGRQIDQGTISRYLKSVKAWIKAGNAFPDMPNQSERATPMDPAEIDRGARRDGRTKRQREKLDGDK
jgi:hypothetical protein